MLKATNIAFKMKKVKH